MKITLTQSDIVEALRAHVAAQGINLTGKSVDIKFTMKKLGAGVEADVSIENVPQLPDLSDETVSSPGPTLVMAVNNAPKAVVTPVVTEPVVTEAPVVAEPAVEPATEVPAEPTAEPAAKTTSLFN